MRSDAGTPRRHGLTTTPEAGGPGTRRRGRYPGDPGDSVTPAPQLPPATVPTLGSKNMGDKMKDALMNELNKLPCKLRPEGQLMFLNVHSCPFFQ